MSETKALAGVEIKDAEQGTVQAVFAKFDVIDLDGDVTLKGAFDDQAPVRISAYGHKTWDGDLPVGRGRIVVAGDEAILDGRFFLGSTAGRDTFETVKEMDDLQEWSYGFDIVDSEFGTFEGRKVRFLKKLKVHEVSPVLFGAGVGTRTLAVKHDEPFSEQADRVLGDATSLLDRAKTFGSQAAEAKEGRVLSAANRERLQTLADSLGTTVSEIRQLLADTDPQKDRHAVERELLRFEQLRAS